MVTGDNITTAIAISKEAGIISQEIDVESGYICMTGPDFRNAVGGLTKKKVNDIEVDCVTDQETFDKITKELRVLARSSPEDKYLLVTGLRSQG